MSDYRYIHYEPLKTIPGLAFRHFAGEADHQIRLDILNACKAFNHFPWITTLTEIINDEKWSSNYDINQQLVYVELEEKPIGYLAFNWEEELTGNLMFFPAGNILPEYMGRGIEQLMLNYTEEKCREMAAVLPKKKDKFIRFWQMEAAQDRFAFFEKNGYTIERYFFEMDRPIDKPLGDFPMPAGLQIREAKPEHFRKIWDADQEAFRDHWGYAEPTEDMFEVWQQGRRFNPALWKIAWEGDQVCGMVRNYLDEKENQHYGRKRGYTEEISVRRPWRKRGLAKALIAESIRMFRDMGMEDTALGVDAENPNGALQLYGVMGYEVDKSKTSLMLKKRL